jgi:hypothetical protein
MLFGSISTAIEVLLFYADALGFEMDPDCFRLQACEMSYERQGPMSVL